MIKDTTRDELKALIQSGEGAVNSCKNNLETILAVIGGTEAKVLTKIYDDAEKIELED